MTGLARKGRRLRAPPERLSTPIKRLAPLQVVAEQADAAHQTGCQADRHRDNLRPLDDPSHEEHRQPDEEDQLQTLSRAHLPEGNSCVRPGSAIARAAE